MGVISRP